MPVGTDERFATNVDKTSAFLQHFSRITSRGRGFIPQIDGLRFIAVLAVLAFHVQQIVSFHFGQASRPTNWVSLIFLAGSKGVQLFFTISGFVLALPFARTRLSGGVEPVSLRAYYLRRLTRLEPPYIIHLIILSLLTWLVLRHQPSHHTLYQNPDWAGYAAKHIGASVVYGHGLIFGEYPYPNIVLWSLEVEVQFYILAPLLSAVFYISSPAARRILIAALICALPLVCRSLPVELTKRILLFNNLPFFFGGFLLADLYLAGALTSPRRWDATAIMWDLILTAAVVAMVYFNQIFVIAWLIFVICVAAFKGWASSLILGNPWIITIGGMCYTIYMYHSLLISLLARGTKALQTHVLWFDYLTQMVILSAFIIPICAVLFLLTERPFMQRNWPSKLWNGLRSLAPWTRSFRPLA